ncbi:sigma-54-dependent Fis family transcriptional regulator [bacterium]|nr:sigma-54-dependent Fis family transcriptional regulator [bacterium]
MSSPSTVGTLGMEGRSRSFMQMMETIQQVAPTHITVLITGESGTGKEMVARAIHRLSPRREQTMISVNCGAIPEGILESELFGHEKGSFTGASETRKGYFEAAHNGTIFLDEIGEMPLSTQVKFLRVLETREFMRVGGTTPIKVDVRVLAASNRNLAQAVEQAEFRNDLFFRLNAVTVDVPPLRHRDDDIRLLTHHFSQVVADEHSIIFEGFTEDALIWMEDYAWPGNIRELRNLVERLIILEKGRQIDKVIIQRHMGQTPEGHRNLPVHLKKTTEQAERELIYRALIDLRMAVEDIRTMLLSKTQNVQPVNMTTPDNNTLDLKSMEQQLIEKALQIYHGNRRKAAEALGLGERTLYRKLKEYGLEDM